MEIIANGINDAWLQVIKSLKENGKESAPRGQKIKEIQNFSVEIKDPKKRVLSLPIRNISLPFAFGELCWYLEGRNDVDMMSYYSKKMRSFSDDGETLNSAYGYRMFGKHPMLPFNQWDNVVNQLKADKDTRQAIVHLHTPNNKKTKDEVCTLSLQFFIRENKLDMVVNMRSNDIIWGLTYDVFSFTSFQELMANELGIEVGKYFHNAASMHIYEKDFGYFDHLAMYDSLMYMTQYDLQFDYDGITKDDIQWQLLFNAESSLRITSGINANGWGITNEALSTICEVFTVYKIYKEYGKDIALMNLEYDNVYDGLMRNYFHKENLMSSSLVIVEGSDGAGKSTLISRLPKDEKHDIVAFRKPTEDFNILVYFQTALTRGNIILDRFYYSEYVYSKVLNRESKLSNWDIKVIEELLNYRKAGYVFMDTAPEICYERLDEEDFAFFDFEQIKEICQVYRMMFRVSEIKNKSRLVVEVPR
jgi:thymidylate synthase